MLKIFKGPDTWGEKVNFVDDANVVVGYDLASQCCECADYCFSRDPKTLTKIDTLDQATLDLLRFDPESLQESEFEPETETFCVSFRLVGDDAPWYLILSNCQNGYYSHGFTVAVNGKGVRDGSL